MYIKYDRQDVIIITLYVDDMIITGNNTSKLEQVKVQLKNQFKINDLGELKFILGIEVKRDRKNHQISLSQEQYIKDMLKKFNMNDCKPMKTPADGNLMKIIEGGKPLNSKTPYMEAIGSLIYIMVASRPDISYIVGILSRYMQNPTDKHWKFVKRVFAYLKGTSKYFLTYKYDNQQQLVNDYKTNLPEVIGYSDSDFAADTTDRKSIGAYTFVLNSGAISWISKKQQTVAKSTSEAEYMALSQAASEALWIRKFLSELNFYNQRPIMIYGDNQGSIKLSKNPQYHNRTKHIDNAHHFIRDYVESNHIQVNYIPTDKMIADILTKPLQRIKFEKHRNSLGIISASGGVGILAFDMEISM